MVWKRGAMPGSERKDKVRSRFADAKGTVARTLKIIQCFGGSRVEWTLGDIARSANLPRSTAHRLLGLMQQEGFVEADARTRQYRPGPEFYRIAATLSANMPIIPLAMPILHDIARRSDETTLLSMFYPKQLQKAFVAQVESSRSMRYVIELNTRGSMLWGASAHAILAFLDEPTTRVALGDHETSPSTGLKVNRNALRRELARIRTEGYARSVGERVETAVGIAVPVFGAEGLVKGSLSITYPESRMDEAHNRTLIVLLQDGARALSTALGWDGKSGNPSRQSP
jgi:IclR family transcriptional regulator, acetate operon repressor